MESDAMVKTIQQECSPPDVGGKVGCGLSGLREPTAPSRGFSRTVDAMPLHVVAAATVSSSVSLLSFEIIVRAL